MQSFYSITEFTESNTSYSNFVVTEPAASAACFRPEHKASRASTASQSRLLVAYNQLQIVQSFARYRQESKSVSTRISTRKGHAASKFKFKYAQICTQIIRKQNNILLLMLFPHLSKIPDIRKEHEAIPNSVPSYILHNWKK